MGLLDFIFGGKKRQVETYMKNGAVILDVRSKKEWDSGHIENAINIPLDELHQRVDEVKKLNKPIITCCQSGVRSAKAVQFLNLNTINTINGGGWVSLKAKLS
jgi:rhodanese-related sulfurtransferase